MTAEWAGPPPEWGSTTGDAGAGRILWDAHVFGEVNLLRYFGRERGGEVLFPEDRIEAERATYVPVLGYQRILIGLRARNVVVLTGAAHRGRTTTGLVALAEVLPRLSVHRLRREPEGGGFGLDHPAAEREAGYILELDGEEDPPQLGRLIERVRDLDAYLVLVTDEVTWRRLSLAHQELTAVNVAQPDAKEVYRRHLAHRMIGDDWPEWPEGLRLLTGARPGDAARLASLVAEARRAGLAGGDPDEQRRAVKSAYLGWSTELTRWFGGHRGPHDRVLLITVAALQPIPGDTALACAVPLAAAMGEPGTEGRLGWPSVTELPTRLDAVTGEEGLRFPRPGYARAVLEHVWEEYPLVREHLAGWLADLPASVPMRRGTLNTLVDTYLELAARARDGAAVTEIVPHWLAAGRQEAAVRALSQGGVDLRIGGHVRRRLLDWARRPDLDQALKLAITDTCRQLGEVHLSAALTRLKHLAAHGNAQVRDEVVAVVESLADRPYRLYAVASEVIGWTAPTGDSSDTAARRATGAQLFMWLAKKVDSDGLPLLLVGRPALAAGDTRSAWTAVLMWKLPEFHTVVRSWLDAAADRTELRETVTATLLDAAVSASAYGRLTGAVKGWRAHRDDEDGRAVHDDLTQRLLEAQRGQVDPWVRVTGDLLCRFFRF
ncbi:MAG: hypothetical protein GEV11_05515 [Streptosporangiales bacterium]|nr:hypothetical protein [Streptosporangiales bacterium]